MKLDRRGVIFLLRNPFLAPFRTTGSLPAITNMSNYDNASTPSLRRTEWMVGVLGFATVAITTWGFAGKSSWAPLGFTVLGVADGPACLRLAGDGPVDMFLLDISMPGMPAPRPVLISASFLASFQ
jgi:hypothetical protein